jgi:hypothetical protein
MDKIVGFADIKKNATTCRGAIDPNQFIGKLCAVLEFGVDDCVLVLNPESTALAMFDKEDVYRSFKCGYVNGVVTPPNLDTINEMAYVMKVQMRKGGYNNILRNMVVEASLRKGEFCDSFLWQLQ